MTDRPLRRPALRLIAAFFICGGIAAGCASAPVNDKEALAAFKKTNDPLEPLNRSMFDLNLFLDKMVMMPVAVLYRDVVPEPARNVAKNMVDNLKSPVTFANDVMQLESKRANNTFWRFVLNSSFGFFGAADVATGFGFPPHKEDFGQTLAVAGVGEGPYLMVPFLGPMNPRDALGRIVDIFLDPFTYVVDNPYLGPARFATDAVDFRTRNFDAINDLERSSLDYYATARSLYRQSRNDDIRNGRRAPAPVRKSKGGKGGKGGMPDIPDMPDMPDMPDIPDMPDDPEPPGASR